ncbi:CoA ester lyase [Saxibacter everestensis]|uniref:CoA ester lyase n=1 Tax=Saxibacter everestensis TaxID=2909229 RepID=A0ABY8QT94_9MICO|nr:CoA ester lyase [Brevibacteriaceae bacterium ZFBP1038]
MTGDDGIFWRSLLYVPVTSRRFVEKAHTRGADAIQLDVEDSIPPGEKDAARRLLPAAIDEVAGHGVDVVVRINRPWRIAIRDLEVAVRPGVRALALPKVASADHLRIIDEVVTELESAAGMPVGTVRFVAMVETVAGFWRLQEIAGASPRVVALTLGSEDFATSSGIPPEPDLQLVPNQMTVLAARAVGVLPIGLVSSIANYQDQDAFRQTVLDSRRQGFVGASAIHPSQVPIINEGFSPTADEVELARRMLAEFDAAAESGIGAIQFDGKMVDEPIVQRARALLQLADRVASR